MYHYAAILILTAPHVIVHSTGLMGTYSNFGCEVCQPGGALKFRKSFCLSHWAGKQIVIEGTCVITMIVADRQQFMTDIFLIN